MRPDGYLTTALLVALTFSFSEAWANDKKVKLEDVKTLTLYHGRMTAGGRSKPVPQVQCVGGSAGCGSFVPQVVQCYNQGSDGYDVQWECKTDMDTSFRFGKVDVVCEGYDYPNDPYVLKGSCGLEYTLDLTEEGFKQKSGHNYYSSGSQNYHTKEPKSTKFGDLIIIGIVLLFMYGLYRTCVRQNQYSTTSDDSDRPDQRYGTGFGYPSTPPPPGFRSDYNNDAGCGGTNTGYSQPRGGGANNFWSGAMAGGLLGYMFGNRNNSGYRTYYDRPHERHSGFSGFSGSSGSSGFSSGTRTASGFGGTRRR